MRHTVLVVDDEASIADGLRLTLEAEGYSVRLAGSVRTALAAIAQTDAHVAIVDIMLPDGDGLTLTKELKARDASLEVIVITAYGSVRKAMEATKGAGAFHIVEKPFEPEEVIGLVRNALERRKLVVENSELRRRLVEQTADSEILGSAPGIQRVLETVNSVADADANVLILGESGTGKELIANALHERSSRREGPWIKINCAALPKDLIESELFGHTKGSFTGATTEKVGLLEEAHKGSLLLDEITEMPIDLQAKLLRVLEERVVRRLGGAKSIDVDFRLISSSNRALEQAVKDGYLRQDLLFRINTVTIVVPPLRERREDIPILVRAFLDRYRAKHARAIEEIEPEAYRRMLSYPWPGNVRELQHAIERAVLVARGREITLADLPETVQHASGEPGAAGAIAPSEVPSGSLEEIERASILKALDSTRWNKQAAAALLGLRRPTLYSKMRKHNIPQRRA
ncbi:MAG TPA: sigma-54 dependent transcriptional regulator [Candidatus Limnocylindria bacterium]|nr:sigma-54 dependent transcriptional regulator [Candidatus Limnocylindria bacterium]